MDNFIGEIRECPLFKGIAPDRLGKISECMVTKKILYKKGDIIARAGDKVDFIGWILDGNVLFTYDDIDGNSTIVGSLSAPELFGETLAYSENNSSPLTISALGNCEILIIKFKNLKSPCKSMCPLHVQMMINIAQATSTKMHHFLNKIAVMSNQTIREKVLCFLNIMKEQNGSAKKFIIPYNREQMAKYICVNQSALSKELRKMSDEGLLRFNRNEFELL